MGALLDAARARKAEEQQRAKQSSAPVDMSKMQGPRIPPLVGYKADTQVVQGMKELNRSFTPQIYKDVVEAAQQKPVNFADYPKRFENLDKKPLYELMKNPVLSNIPAKSNAEKIREFTGIDKPLYELMRNPQLFQSEVQNKQLTWQEKLQNAVQGQSAEFKPALAANLQAIADENSKPKGFFSNIGAAMRSGGRSLEKGFAGTMGGIADAIHQAFGAPNETSISAYLKDDIKVLEKIQSEQPELMEDINKYFEQTKNGGRVNLLLHLKVMSKMHPADFAKIVTMAQMRNPLFYLEDSDNQKAQAKGQTALYLQQRQIPQKDEEYSVQKDTAPQWQQSAMSVAEQVPTQAVNIGAGLLGGGVGGGITAGINAMGNGYIEAQERENNPLKSLGVGAAKGVLEGATSAIPIGELAGGMKALAAGGVKGGISSTLKSIGKQVLTQELEENVQEQLSLFGGKVVDQIAYGDGGWDTYGQEAWQTAKDTTISTLFFSGVSLGGSAAYGKINPIAKAQIQKGVNAVEQKVKNGTLTKQNFESDPDVQAVARLAKMGMENAAQSGKLNDIVTESGGENATKYSSIQQNGNTESFQSLITKLNAADDKIADMQPVAQLSGQEFPKSDKKLTEQVAEFFDSIGGKVENPQIGEVLLTERGIKDSIAHGIGRTKAITFAAVPSVIENGRIIDYVENWKERGYNTYVIAAPVTINGEIAHVGAIINEDKKTHRYYLHETILKKDAPFKTGRENDFSEPGGASVEPSARSSDTNVSLHPVNTSGSVDPTIPQNGGEVNTNIRENLQNDTSQDVQRAATVDPNAWNKAQNINENAKYTPLHEIRDFIQDKFHIRIDTGKIQQKNALGIFKVKGENIRSQVANDIPTIAHELGHYLDKKYNFRDMTSISEAAALLSEDFKKNYKDNELSGEAAAEFMRNMLHDKTFAQEKSPNFYNEFMEKLDKDDRQNIEKLADMVNGYFTGDIDTSSAIVSKLDMKNNDGLLSNTDKVYTNWLDDMHPIKKFEEYAQKSGDYKGTKAYRDAINSKNVNAVVNNAITGKLADYDGNIVGDSLKDVMSAIKPEEVNAFSDYLISKHAPLWIEKGRTVYADPRANNVEYLNKKVQDFEQKYPHFKESSESLYKFNKQVGQTWLVDTGLISQDLWDKMNAMYPFYVPMNRAVSNSTGGKAKSGFANQNSGIRRAKGSGEAIINPIESVMMNTDRMIRAGTRNKVMRSIANAADGVDGMGWLMEQVAPDQVPRSVQVADYKEQLADAIAAESRRSGGAAEFEDAITGLIDSILPDTVTEFSPAQVQKNGIVSVMKDGKAQYYKVYDADLYNALTAMGSLTQQVLPKIAKVTRAFTSLTTGSNPLFTIGSNIWRDYQTAYINNKTTYNPAKFFTDYITTVLHDMRTNSPEYQQFKALGGGESSMLSNVNDYKTLLKELNTAGKNRNKAQKAAEYILHPLKTIVKALDIVETAPRFAEFKRTLKQTGDTQQAIYNAKEVTTNFARGGKKAKAVNAFTPFFNASLQGTDLLLRRVKEAPVQTLTKMFVGTVIPSLITWAWNHRDEEAKKEYNALSPYQKNSFYNFNIGGRTFFKIPKAEGNGLIASLTERILDQAAGGNGEAFDDFAGYVLNQIMPPLVPTDSIGNLIDRVTGLPSREVKLEDFGDGFRDIIGIGTLMGLGSNSDFKGTPIVPAYMEDYAQKDQYDESTSYVATALGRITGLSPKKLDHVINSNFGYLGALNKSFAPNKTIKDFMGIAGKFSANSAYSTNIFNNFYEEAAQAGRDANSNPNDKDVALKSKQYDNFKSYVSKTNGLIKKEIFPERQETLKAQLRDEVQQFREGLPSLPDNAVRVYKETGESSVLPLANLDSGIKKTKGKGANKTTTEHTLTTEQYKEYVRTYQQYVGEEYGKVNLAGKNSDTQVKNLKSANEVAKEKAKQYMLDKHFK